MADLADTAREFEAARAGRGTESRDRPEDEATSAAPDGALRAPAPTQGFQAGRIRAHELGTWTDAPSATHALTRLYHEDSLAFAEIIRAAWADRRWEVFVRLAMIRWEQGNLKPSFAERLCRLLLLAEDHVTALRLLGEPSFPEREAAAGLVLRARALAGLGQVDEALAAARRALKLEPSSGEAASLSSSLKKIRRWQAEPARLTSWPDRLALVDCCVAVGLRGWIGRLLHAFCHPWTPLTPDERLSLLGACGRAARYLTEPGAAAMVQALSRLLRGRDRELLLQAQPVLEGLASAPPKPPVLSAKKAAELAPLQYMLALCYAGAGLRPLATRELGRLTHPGSGVPGAHDALARLVGDEVLSRVRVNFAPPGPRQVFDLFPFNGEHALLELKLAEMSPWVDYFVIVESSLTFTGLPKPLYFGEAKARYGPYLPKILHVVVDEFPDHIDSAWAREFYQRDMAIAAIGGRWAREDIVLLSDVDEIVRREAVEGFRGASANIALETYRYFLNYRRADREGGVEKVGVVRAKELQHIGSSFARSGLYLHRKEVISAGGWHFTSIGGSQAVLRKLQSYSHQENNVVRQKDVSRLLDRIRAGEHEAGWERVDIDDSFPAYVRDHPERFSGLVLDRPGRPAGAAP